MGKRKGFAVLELLVVGVVICLAVVFWWVKLRQDVPVESETLNTKPTEVLEEPVSDAVKAGQMLSHNNCTGEGAVLLSVSPMKEEDFAFIIPYGLMAGGHVTPIDHQYFSPTIFHSPRDTYNVYAMADGKVVEIARRLNTNEQGEIVNDEYRIVFMHTCTFFTYYDLVTSLTPDVADIYDQHESNNYAIVDIPVKAGDMIGKIGGQTLDYAVWDTKKPLSGYIHPEHYNVEGWKIYTADPYPYYSDELRELLTRKNLRTADPIAGKIDYDQSGTLVGNWFLDGTVGYNGGATQEYWKSHLALVYDHLDPTAVIVSIGNYDGQPEQFAVIGNAPDPKDVSVETGLIKYDLVDFQYLKPDGGYWDRDSLVRGLTLQQSADPQGCMLVQLVAEESLEMELFPNQRCSTVTSFTGAQHVYNR